MNIDLTLYLVTDTRMCAERGVLTTVTEAVRGGVTAVQLRDSDASVRGLCAIAAALVDRLAGTGVPLLVNDRLDVALAAGAQGVHLGQSDLPVESARAIAGPAFLIGLSVSTAQEVSNVARLAAGTVDYLGVGPVFPTPTKPQAAPAVGLDGLAELRRSAALPCIAIGGINKDNAGAVRATGVEGLAVVSAICASDDPAGAATLLAGIR
ncbi:MAG TPA: thiamine phosphate synthase [Mycobacteriales bacterium]|nr:thiamine phosphate synthase [Mycobacteriales bacterium]